MGCGSLDVVIRDDSLLEDAGTALSTKCQRVKDVRIIL